MFDLAAHSNIFRDKIDVHRKIANLCEETFRWDVRKSMKRNSTTLNSAAASFADF